MVDGKVHPSDEMTSRRRLLAAYRRQGVDRLPYWAKVANTTWRAGQPRRVRLWSDRELLDYIFADGIFHVARCARAETPRVQTRSNLAGQVRTTVTHTPDGDLRERWTMDGATRSWHPTEFPVKDLQDLRRFRWLFAGRPVLPVADDVARARQTVQQVGQRGITLTAWGTGPLMHLIEHVIGPAETFRAVGQWMAGVEVRV